MYGLEQILSCLMERYSGVAVLLVQDHWFVVNFLLTAFVVVSQLFA